MRNNTSLSYRLPKNFLKSCPADNGGSQLVASVETSLRQSFPSFTPDQQLTGYFALQALSVISERLSNPEKAREKVERLRAFQHLCANVKRDGECLLKKGGVRL